LRERAILLKIAAELVELKPFFIPVYHDTRRRPWQLQMGLWMYKLLGGFDSATRFGRVPRADWDTLDGLKVKDLDAVIRYHDGQTDDALLTRAVVYSAQELGAELAMPADFLGATLREEGVVVRLNVGGANQEFQARVLVNAAGPWAPQVANAVAPAIYVPQVDLVQGTHIVLPVPLNCGIYYVESPTDGRAVFVMPWYGATLVGTTETPYRGDPGLVHPLPQEEEYLLNVVRHYFPHLNALTGADIARRFAGLRVLPAAAQKAFDRSRETIFTVDREARPRVLGIYGGKLTGWRAAADHVLKRVSGSLPASARLASTDQLILRRPT
jgi:glycerol-3-phosphate dehydrogenase